MLVYIKMKSFNQWNRHNDVRPRNSKPHGSLYETSKHLFGLSDIKSADRFTTYRKYDNPIYKPGMLMHGSSHYIDPGFMNQSDYGRGGFISTTMNTPLEGRLPSSTKLVKVGIIKNQVIPGEIADLPMEFKKEVDIKQSTLLERTKNENSIELKADSRIYNSVGLAPMDYNTILKQPDYVQDFLLQNLDDDVTNPKADDLVTNLIKTRFQSPLGLKKMTFNSIPGSKSVSESINKIIDGILTENMELHPGTLKSDDLKYVTNGQSNTPNSSKGIDIALGVPSEEGKFPGKFSDERHAYSLKNRGYYQFLGPGTHVKQRRARGDKPINGLDQTAFVHDISYQIFADDLDKGVNVTKQQVRSSDMRLIKGLKLNMKDEPLVARVAISFIETKMRSEDIGVLDYLYFVKNKNSSGSPIGT
jgi:hypothetical protein